MHKKNIVTTILHSPLFILFIALLQGIRYLTLIPPWQHYDEPGHFEYAWLLAHNSSWFEPGKADAAMRQQVVESLQQHNFFWNLAAPTPGWWFSITQLQDPPLYYTLVSLPLEFVQTQSIDIQLYVARAVSLMLFLLTIAVAHYLMRDLTSPGHPLRWAVPLWIAMLPPFADMMTAVNNQVGGIFLSSLFLWGAVRCISAGLSWQHIIWIIVTALLAWKTWSATILLVALIPVVVVFAWWVQRGWRWRWLIGASSIAFLMMLFATVGWGDSAAWYRWHGASAQIANTRATPDNVPFGKHAILLQATPDIRQRRLVNPVLPDKVKPLAGNTITIGGWIWANRPATVKALGIAHSQRPGEAFDTISQPLNVTTTPTFYAWTFEVPAETQSLHYVYSVTPPRITDAPLDLFLDGAVLVQGAYPPDAPPVFDTPTAQSGTWDGKPFVNLIRNGSAEQSWVRLRPWLATAIQSLDIGWGRTPSLLLAAIWDTQRTRLLLSEYVGFLPFDSLFNRFAWGQITLEHPLLQYTLRIVATLALIGCVVWWIRSNAPPNIRASIALLAIALMLLWLSTITRVLPKISEGVVFPLGRYTFPVIIPTALVVLGGIKSLVPRSWQLYAILIVLCGIIVLNGAAVWTIWAFYQTVAG